MAINNDDQLVERLVPKILSAIRSKSKPVETLAVKDNLNGITSIPCYDTTGLQFKAVLVPIDVLRAPVLDAAAESIEALNKANEAYEQAVGAVNTVYQTNEEALRLLNQLTESENERNASENEREINEEFRESNTSQAITRANEAAALANQYAANAQDVANHPTYVGADNYVYQWNNTNKTYNKTDVYVRGESFSISKVYNSIVEMENDTETTFKEGDFCLINTNNVEDPDDAKLYVRTKEGTWSFLVDMSGAIGFTGKTPQIFVGNVSVGNSKSSASVTMVYDGVDIDGNPKYKYNFVVPCLSYEDLTEAQLEELKKPANDMIVLLQQTNLEIQANESSRQQAEQLRTEAEALRDSAESNRLLLENTRYNAEQVRINNENTRQGNESLRQQQELLREDAEALRVNAETQREATIQGIQDALNEKQDKIDILDLMINFYRFYEGVEYVDSLSEIIIDRRLVIANISQSEPLSLESMLSSGREIHVIINNTASESISIALPNNGNYVCLTDTALSLDAGAYAEVNVISDGSKMYIRSI